MNEDSMNEAFEKIDQALTMLENAEVMQEFEDSVWLKVDRAEWEEYVRNSEVK
jgi:hypothetical protein